MTKLDSGPPSQQLQPGDEQILPLEYFRVGWGSWHKNLNAINDALVYNAEVEKVLFRDANVVNTTSQFLKHWSAPVGVSNQEIVLVRGLFGAWIPNHMKVAKRGLQSCFANTSIVSTIANATAERNCILISQALAEIGNRGNRVHLLCHSKGGLETLLAIARIPSLARCVLSLTLVQCARHPSPVLSHWLGQPSYFPYPALFAVINGRPACEELCDPHITKLISECDAAVDRLGELNIPVIGVASSTSLASRSLESQHALMSKLHQNMHKQPCPLHDGLFYTNSLEWHRQHPQVKQIYLPDLDHSQPGVGGAGFDPARFWLALACNAIEYAGE
jgi:hypothetical protein